MTSLWEFLKPPIPLVDVTLCMMGIFSYVLSFADFFSNTFFSDCFQEYHLSVKQFGSRSGSTSCQAYGKKQSVNAPDKHR